MDERLKRERDNIIFHDLMNEPKGYLSSWILHNMGEIAEMMLDGTLCEGCGEFLDHDGEAAGYPRYCSTDCSPSHDEMFFHGNEENEADADIELAIQEVDNALAFLEISADILRRIKMFKKMKSVKGIIKNIEIFKTSIRK